MSGILGSAMFSKLIILTILLFPGSTVMLDRIAAVVNDEVITYTDIDKAISFFPFFRTGGESEEAYYARILDDLIAYKAVYLEYRDDFTLAEEDYEEVQTPIIAKLGSLDRLVNFLKKYDMEWPDFKEFITEKVLYEKVLKEKFHIQVDIAFTEIETFYTGEYLPLQVSLGLKPMTLIEMTPLIEKHLSKTRSEAQLSTWINELKAGFKIENKLR